MLSTWIQKKKNVKTSNQTAIKQRHQYQIDFQKKIQTTIETTTTTRTIIIYYNACF